MNKRVKDIFAEVKKVRKVTENYKNFEKDYKNGIKFENDIKHGNVISHFKIVMIAFLKQRKNILKEKNNDVRDPQPISFNWYSDFNKGTQPERKIPTKTNAKVKKGYKLLHEKGSLDEGITYFLEGLIEQVLRYNQFFRYLTKETFPKEAIEFIEKNCPDIQNENIEDRIFERLDEWNDQFKYSYMHNLFEKMLDAEKENFDTYITYKHTIKQFRKYHKSENPQHFPAKIIPSLNLEFSEDMALRVLLKSKIKKRMFYDYDHGLYRTFINKQIESLCVSILQGKILGDDDENNFSDVNKNIPVPKSAFKGKNSDEMLILDPEITEFYTRLVETFQGNKKVNSTIKRQIKRYLYLAKRYKKPINIMALEKFIKQYVSIPEEWHTMISRSGEYGFVVNDSVNGEKESIDNKNEIESLKKVLSVENANESSKNEIIKEPSVTDFIDLLFQNDFTIKNQKNFVKQMNDLLGQGKNKTKMIKIFYKRVLSKKRESRPNNHWIIKMDNYGCGFRLVRRGNTIEFIGNHGDYDRNYTSAGNNLFLTRQ